MELIKNNTFNLPDMAQLHSNVMLLKDAFDRGELQLARSETYKKKKAKKGHIFYLIHYVTGKGGEAKSIYRGAWEMPLDAEDELLKKESLVLFLLTQVTLILTKTN